MRFRRNRPETMWHGTCTPLALEILASGGFVPEPPRKRWDASTGHMASYRGTYFTNNWMTAWAAAGNAVDKFGGEKVMFQTVIELEQAIPDEDHLPCEHDVLAHSVGLSFMPARYAHELLRETRPETLREVLNAAVEAYLADVEQRFVNRYGRHPDLKLSPRVRAELYYPVFRLMKALLKAIARLYSSASLSGYRDYHRSDETPELRTARDEVAVALRGLLDEIPREEWREIFNARIDKPVGMQGLHRIVAAIEVTYPKEIGPDGPENPYIIRPLLGEVTQEFMDEFVKHVMGHLTHYRVVQPEQLQANPPPYPPVEMTGREESALAWLREYWEANSEWRIARSHDWPSAGRHAMQMRRAMNALRYFGLVRKTRPLPSVESYMAHLWKKYYPESQA